MYLSKYRKNLHTDGNKVISYTTHVATIDRSAGILYVHGYWSATTSKHINYVASTYGLEKVERARGAEELEQERKDTEAKALAMSDIGLTEDEAEDAVAEFESLL